MPAIYTGVPFTVEGRMSDPDSFPNPYLSYTWSIVSQPPNSTLVFLQTNSVTPSLIVDTPGNYQIQLTAFDGAAFTSAPYSFTASGMWGASAYLAGSCASTGSGLATTVQAVYSNATSILSQNDANAKAAATAASALSSVLSCCPASYVFTFPVDAPSGSVYSTTVIPADANPNEDFGSGTSYIPAVQWNIGSGAYVTVGSGSGLFTTIQTVVAGSKTELFTNYKLFAPVNTNYNQPLNLTFAVQELEPVNNTPVDVTDFILNLNPQTGGNLAGATVKKVQKHAASFAPLSGVSASLSRALGWELSIPQPMSSKVNLSITGRVPPLSTWQMDAAGWDWNSASPVNTLGLFILTGGTLAAPTSEALIMSMNTGNSEPPLLNAYYNFYGYGQIPYQGSLYGYSDRRAFASIPHTGFVNTPTSPVQFWTSALINYINANRIPPPWNVYFRSGTWNGVTSAWVSDSVPLYLERSTVPVAIGSLSSAGVILSAANSVLIFQAGAIATTPGTLQQSFFATVRGGPLIILDNYRFNAGLPAGVSVGVYIMSAWGTSSVAVTPLPVINPGPIAGRGYDVNNLATYSLVKTALGIGSVILAFYVLDANGTPIPNSFPLSVTNLTNYAPANPMYSVGDMPAGIGNIPASSANVLFINNPGAKVYCASANG